MTGRAGGAGDAKFHTTMWTLVRSAGEGHDASSDRALAILCERYWFPVYAFARRRGHSAEEAEDLVQGFFSHLLEKRFLSSADRERGRFRSFLLGAFKYYLSDQATMAAAERRGGGSEHLPLELEGAERRYQLEADPAERPDRLFARKWSLELLAQARRRLDQEIEASADPRRGRALAAFLTEAGGTKYKELAEQLETSEGAIKVAIHRLRRRFGALLREEVADTVSDPARIDEELRELFASLE